ncbi:6-pyruvoyl tetrahydropterin synthase protein [Edwardsiella phage vB_EpM_ZHS]|jgi:6-pyruvoyltetrahydropterin/6-carboxytetrahydropterin synthase|nr:6-pyruvoyl tetrahydropterin synthase protein [Edwardsiella phage vB_EpM_ZHS]
MNKDPSIHLAHQSTKTYGHDVGLSCVFRQWRANSHCNQLHGYALAVRLVFKSSTLDSRNWVVDFGALKPVKAWLQHMFDHTVLVAVDDPELRQMQALADAGVIDLRNVTAVGCEAFAQLIGEYVNDWLFNYNNALFKERIKPPENLHCAEVQVSEHGANSASWFY